MPKAINSDLIVQAQQAFETAQQKAEEYSGLFGSVKGFILDNFGQNGLIAAYIVTAALVLVLVSRLAKIGFSTLKYLVIPALTLAFVGAYFLPYSFIALLPVSVAGCSLVFIFKG